MSAGLGVLFLAPQPFFEVRGTPLAVRALVSTLAAMGHRVDLLAYPQGEDVRLEGVRVLRSLPLPVGRVKAGPSVGKLLLDGPFAIEAVLRMVMGRYDVVHAVEEAALFIAPVAAALGLPLVVDVDSSIPDQLRYSGFARRGPLLWLAERLESFALRRSTAVVTVCTSLTDGVCAKAPRAKVFQIEDPPLVEAPVTDAAALSALRASLGLDGRPVVLYSGNFEPYQGVDLLVEAAREVPEAQFVFMGGEPDQIAALSGGAGGRSVFAGKRPPSDLPLFLGLAAVLASPRHRGENTPFKVYTYLASGKPIVATRIPTHTQLLNDDLAFLVEPTPSGLAAGVRAALSDPKEAARRAGRGRELIEREYSVLRYREKVGAAYAAIAEAVAARRGRS